MDHEPASPYDPFRPPAGPGRPAFGRTSDQSGAFGDGAVDDDLAGWVADLAVDDAIRDRSRTQWMRHQASQEGSFAGILADLGERGGPVLVHLQNGRLHRGPVTVVGADYAAVRVAADREVVVALGAIASVRTLPGEPATIGDRYVRATGTLAELLATMADDRVRVLVLGLDAAHGVAGELRSAGRDVITVRLDGGGGVAYVALASVAEISVPVSG